jgi:glycosyltransferase involved in cell wall biosynthesis
VTGTPLVSCVMPTRDRRRFAQQAIWYFLRQDYPHRELIVLDDGYDAIEDLANGDERIRYVRLSRGTSVGAKRNLGCELARGELVAQWDDDDWIGQTRLSTQVAELIAAGADVHASRALLHYRVDAGDGWLLRPRWPAAPDLPPGPMLYRASLGARHRFGSDSTGEQRPFLASLAPERVLAADVPWYLAVVHRTNVSGRSLDDGRWEPWAFDEVAGRLDADRRFYATLRHGQDMPTRRGGIAAADVSLGSSFYAWDGYGLMAEYLALGMERAGARVGILPLGVDPTGLTDELQALLASSRPVAGAPAVWFAPPYGAAKAFPHASDLFINTMWEGDRLPRGWAEPLNAARAVVVPTRFVADVCVRSGVEVPIEVVPEGADPELYPYLERPERAGLTTLAVGPLVRRKHVTEAVAGWQRAFAGDRDARLILKGKFGLPFATDDPRIEVISETEGGRGIAHWYAKADVLLALGNEGFGLPLVEGMATGLPAIALSSEGQGDVCADAGPLVLPVPPAGWEPCDDTPNGPAGVRGVPDVDVVADQLRWVATHRDEARDMGRQASAWAHRERNVWDKGPAVLEVMERRMGRRRPLRRLRTLWPIGPASLRPYVSALITGLEHVRVVTAPPEMAALRLLHVQHPGDPDADAGAAARIAEIALAGVRVVVTAHAVLPRIGPWERDAAVLVATTDADAQALRRRWPAKSVEWIPYGCPPPARARRRARQPGAIAMFGEPPASVAGLENRRVIVLSPGQQPQPELARLLARDCDLVVFADAAAARLDLGAALASGVPVLTAPDPRLADLDGAILQTPDLEQGAVRALADADLRRELGTRAREHCHDNSWERVAQRHVALWAALEAT